MVVVDSNDRDLRDGLQASSAMIEYTFLLNVPERQLSTHLLNGDSVNIGTIENKIRSIPSDQDDTIIFLFCGHGAYDTVHDEHVMTFTNKEVLRRSVVKRELQAKNARVTVLMTDTCSNYVEIYGNSPSANRPSRITPLFYELFVQTPGFVDISATKPGELGMCFARGTTFALGLNGVLGNSNRRLSWQQVLNEINSNTKGISRTHPDVQQTAYAVSPLPDLNSRAVVRPTVRTTPQQYWLGAYARSNSGGGVEITKVVANSPATRIKDSRNNSFYLVPYRDIVTHVNGRAVSTTNEFISAIRQSGKYAKLQVFDKKTRQSGSYSVTLIPAK